jgi:hypothetical protein
MLIQLAAGPTPLALAGAGVVILVLVVAAVLFWWYRSRSHAQEHDDFPLILFPPTPHPADDRSQDEPAWSPRPAPPEPAEREAWPDTGSLPPEALELDGTLQLLPGRLVPVAGGTADGDSAEPRNGAAGAGVREVRFVRVPGPALFTLGRAEGAAPTHIQLPAPTASRMHAFMEFQDRRWLIGNLSTTNPVVVNGDPLDHGDAVPLEDGDRVEFGELVFTFRSR